MYPGIRFPVIEIIVESRVRRSIPVSSPESSLHPVQGQHSGSRPWRWPWTKGSYSEPVWDRKSPHQNVPHRQEEARRKPGVHDGRAAPG